MSAAEKSPVPSDPPPSYTSTTVPAPPPSGPRPRGPLPLDLPILNAAKRKRTILASSSPRRRQLLAQIGLTNVEVIPSSFAEDIPKAGLSPFEYVLQTASAKALAVYRRELETSVAARDRNGERKREPELIIAADTVVVDNGGEILEKPKSERQHVDMLMALRDGHSGPERKAQDAVTGAFNDNGFGALGLGPGMRGEGVAMQSANGAKSGKPEGAWHKVFTAVAVLAPLDSARQPGYTMETEVQETSVKFSPDVSDEMILAYVRTREGADKAGGYGIQGMGTLLVEKIDGAWDNVVGLPLRTTLQLMEKVMVSAADDEDIGGEDLLAPDEEDEED